MEGRPRWLRDAPVCPPGPCSAGGSAGVDDELSVDGVADVALQRSECFAFGLALGDPPLKVGASFGSGLADLADGGHVQGVVEVTVAALREPVHDAPAGGELDGGGAVVGGVAVPVGEPADVTAVADE